MIFHESNYLTFPFKVGIKVRWSVDVIKYINDIGTVISYNGSYKYFICVRWKEMNVAGFYSPDELEIV